MDTKKTWFITGCDTGMGHTAAQVLLEKGDIVVVTARNIDNIASLLAMYPDSSYGFQLDVTDGAQVRQTVASAVSQLGHIDVLFNNAGYGVIGAAEETSEQEYRRMFEVNFFGLVAVTQALLPHMRERRSGHIFNTSSLGGYAASPGFSFYAASKFAVEGFSDSLAQELAAFNIRVVILEPGSFRTQFAGQSLQRVGMRIADYETSAMASTLERMQQRDGKQPNDPAKLAEILYSLSRTDSLPLRLPLGQDAVARVQAKVEQTRTDLEQWKPVSLSCGFEK